MHFRRDLVLRTLLIRRMKYKFFQQCKLRSWNVMFFGNDDFSLVSLQELFQHVRKQNIQNLEVVCGKETRNPVFQFALSKNLKVRDWPPVITDRFDFGVVASFGKLIPYAVITYFSLGILNVHPSILPKYRGAAPIFHALNNGDDVTGISIMKIKPGKFDTGDIIMQETCQIGRNELMPSLKKRLALLGAKCLTKTIYELPQCLDNCVPQCLGNVTNAPKINKQIRFVKWDEITAAQLYNLYRGLYGIYDLRTTYYSVAVKLTCISLENCNDSEFCNNNVHLPPGRIEVCQRTKHLRVHCIDRPVYVCSIAIGDKVMIGFNFYCGYLHKRSKEEWIFV